MFVFRCLRLRSIVTNLSGWVLRGFAICLGARRGGTSSTSVTAGYKNHKAFTRVLSNSSFSLAYFNYLFIEVASAQVPRRSPFVDTERFSLYAPYVKVLDVFSDVIQGYYVSNWDLLLDYSRQHTLLPNLVTLSLRSKYSTHHPVIPLWGALFASSSLRDLLFTRDPFESAPETPQSAVKTLVKCLADKSPRLRTLSIFAESDDVYDDNDGQLEFLPPVREHPLDRALVYITGIRDLCCNLVFLGGKGMDIIGKVPHLESLTIHSDIYVADYSLVTTLPDDSFPSLQQLNLCLSDHEDFATIFKIRPMFSKITTLNICPQDCRVTFPSSVWLVTELFPSLKNVPYLQNLKISFGPTASKRQSYKLAVSRVSNLMSRLPLKSLSLSPAILDFSTLSGLGTTWAQLTYLELPQNYATTSMLAPFAELPKLQHLVIFLHLCLDFGNSYPPGRSNPLPFHTLEASVQSLTYGKDIPARDCPFLHGPFINNCPCAHRVDRLDRIAKCAMSWLWIRFI